MPIYERYDEIGTELERIDPDTVTDGEVWSGHLGPPTGFPEKPDPSPEPGTNTPPLFVSVSHDRPLILVPGILGTALERYYLKGNQEYGAFGIWPPINLANFSTARLDQLTAKNFRPIQAGNNPLVAGAYDELINFLVDELKYELDKNLFIFGYNWTQSNIISGHRLAGFIKLVESQFPWGSTPPDERKVDIICHSMGGLVTRSAIRLWGAKVKRTAYLASPHYGAPKAYGVLHPKISHVPFVFDFLARAFTNLSPDQSIDKMLKDLASRFKSVYELLPDPEYFRLQQGITEVDDYGPNTREKTLQETYYDNGNTRLPNRPMVEEAMQFKNDIGYGLPGDIYFVVCSKAYATDNFAFLTTDYFGDTDGGNMTIDGASPNGDGTVPLISGEGPNDRVLVTGSHTVLPNLRETFWHLAHFLKVT